MPNSTEVQKAKYKEWIEHFLLDGIYVEELNGAFICVTYDHHGIPTQLDPVFYKTSEKAWNAITYQMRHNHPKLAWAKHRANEAMHYNETTYENL